MVSFSYTMKTQPTTKTLSQPLKKLVKKAGVKILKKTNIPEGNECYEAAAQLVDEGRDIIFADSFGHEDYIIQVAKKFPEVQFLHATGTKAHTEGLSNYHNAFASIYEGRFLAGVALQVKSSTK